jgi:anti-sigma factor RsiW
MALVAPAAHQADGPATLKQNFAPLEGCGTTQANFRLARGLDAPSSEVLPRSRGGHPPRVRFRLARGPRGLAASAPPPLTGAFKALTFAGAQVKDESTPRP